MYSPKKSRALPPQTMIGTQILVGLHVDAHSVAHVALDEDLAAAHAVAEHVACVTVNDDRAGVHRVAHAVLRVAEHLDGGSVHEHRHVLAGRAVDLDAQALALDAGADVALSVHVEKLHGLDAIGEAPRAPPR